MQERSNKRFELLVDYRVSAHGNSGINYRNALLDSMPFALKGYQAGIDGEDIGVDRIMSDVTDDYKKIDLSIDTLEYRYM